MTDAELVALQGFNPDNVRGVIVRPTPDCEVYVVPERGLEVLDVLVGGEPAMYRNPAGHRSWHSWCGAGLNPLRHIEGAFTGGLENVGAPNGSLPLHGTFSVTPAVEWSRLDGGEVRGRVDCRRMVTGPSIIVERTVEPVLGRRAFHVVDRLRAEVASDYMWLYHPNFPVEEGAEVVSSETQVVPRPDGIAEHGLPGYRVFENVGRGVARHPAGTESGAVREENFEQCFIMSLQPDDDGVARVMLRSPGRDRAAYIRYRPADFPQTQRAFQLWKNPRDRVSGLEVGSPFLGWGYAAEHGLLAHLGQGEERRYEIEIGFLRGREEVEAFAAEVPRVGPAEPRVLTMEELADFYRAAGETTGA